MRYPKAFLQQNKNNRNQTLGLRIYLLSNGEHKTSFLLEKTKVFSIMLSISDYEIYLSYKYVRMIIQETNDLLINTEEVEEGTEPVAPVETEEEKEEDEGTDTEEEDGTGDDGAAPVVEEEPVVEATDEPAVEGTEEPVAEATDEPVVEATDEPVVEEDDENDM